MVPKNLAPIKEDIIVPTDMDVDTIEDTTDTPVIQNAPVNDRVIISNVLFVV